MRNRIFVVEKLWVDLDDALRQTQRAFIIALRDRDGRFAPKRPGIKRIEARAWAIS